MDSLPFKRHNSFQNQNNRKDKHSFALRPLIFKLQQGVLKKILENQSFENVSFCPQ